MTGKQYGKLVSLVFEEELERTKEFVSAMESGEDFNDDESSWLSAMEYIPSKEDMEKFLEGKGRDIDEDIRILEEEDEPDVRDPVYDDLRDILLG